MLTIHTRSFNEDYTDDLAATAAIAQTFISGTGTLAPIYD